MKTLIQELDDIIGLNEGGKAVAYKFSDPDGVHSGKSGWSFGTVQWDTKNNPRSLDCLRECGFTQDQIDGIVDQTIDVRPLAAILVVHSDIIDRYDQEQLQHCLDSAGQFAKQYSVPVSDSACLLMLADTVNQYGSLGHGSAAYLLAFGRPVTAEDVLAMKLTWKYSMTVPGGKADTIRRYKNVMSVVKANV